MKPSTRFKSDFIIGSFLCAPQHANFRLFDHAHAAMAFRSGPIEFVCFCCYDRLRRARPDRGCAAPHKGPDAVRNRQSAFAGPFSIGCSAYRFAIASWREYGSRFRSFTGEFA
ncbi:hypothetical protein BURCENBC7_AP3184 [Burkholderia cenocepacia BC7]|nr:hypothetical protein BURCENBC7_AP3184 [Burkholderia cenocepacia BC7]